MIQETSSLMGQLLIAMPGMGDVRFEKSLIYVCAHSEDGAMGFMVNRLVDAPTIQNFLLQLNIINEDEQEDYAEIHQTLNLHDGGPVEPGRGFVLHSPDFESKTTLQIDSYVSLTATLEILRAIATGRGPRKSMLALGYAGWAAGQLEEEIAANGWLNAEADMNLLFEAPVEQRYDQALAKLGVNAQLLSAEAGHA